MATKVNQKNQRNQANQSNQPTQPGIADSWSLMDFARIKGSPKRAILTNSDGEEFACLMFPTPDDEGRDFTMVGFSSNLGELSITQIVSRKLDLQVVKLESGTYKLCERGNGAWEDINLF